MENLLAPPLVESLAVICQSLEGKLALLEGVLELDAQVVFLQAQGVETEGLSVDAILADAGALLNDEVIGNDLILVRSHDLSRLVGRFLGRQHEVAALDHESAALGEAFGQGAGEPSALGASLLHGVAGFRR